MSNDKLFLYNAFIPTVIETTHYLFNPVPDFAEKYKQYEKENKHSRDINLRSTEVDELITGIPNSHFYPSQPKVWDYCAVLSLFQSRNIFPFQDSEGGSELFARTGRAYEWPLLTSRETADHLEAAVQKLDNFSDRERYIFIKSLMLLFEGEFFTPYGDFRDVWYLQPIELFCRGVYCLDHGITNPKKAPRHLKFSDYLKYCVTKFGYINQYGQQAQVESFLEDVVTVRNWVMHGKVWSCSVFNNRSQEFVFYRRIESLLKAFLLSYIDINAFTNRDALIHGIAFGNQVVPVWVKG
jgi:hypothetical protein